jgi:hypothetical protein
MWAGILDDVSADIAGTAVREHYRHSGEPVMPADIVRALARGFCGTQVGDEGGLDGAMLPASPGNRAWSVDNG